MALKNRIPSEAEEQRTIVQWLRLQPLLRDRFFKINNEGKRSLAQGANLKALGMRSGASDIFIAFPTSLYHGLFLEVKRNMHYHASAKQSPTWLAQIKFMEDVKSVGYDAHFCYGFDDCKKIVEHYFLSLSPC